MKLGIEDVKKVTLGSLLIEKYDEFFIFSRFNERQISMLIKRGEDVAKRVCCTASVKFEFYTKGGKLSFDYEISPVINREYYSIDLLIEGVYVYNVSENKNTASGKFEYDIPMSEKEKRITVYFPTTVCTKIKDLELPSDATPHRRKKKILVLGDSMLQGYSPNHYQNTCMNILADYFDAEMINQAIGGDCFNKRNLDGIDYAPDFIIVGYGINDWATGRFKNGEDADEYLNRLTEIYPETQVFLILPPDNNYLEKTRKNDDLLFDTDDGNFKNQTIEDVRKILFENAKKYENIIPINAKNFVPQYAECFYSDNVHLTDLGNYIYGNKIAFEISKYCEN